MTMKAFGWPACAGPAFAALLMAPATAHAEQTRQWIELDGGATTIVNGVSYRSDGPTTAIASLSSEWSTVAVVAGALATGERVAHAGEALVTPLDGGQTRRFAFDAARLRSTLPPAWMAKGGQALGQVVTAQRRARFWGRLEPVNLNASAPSAPALEKVRASYLADDRIVALRREAGGDPRKLAALTAQAFAAALAAKDAANVAALVDPKPFTDTGADAAAWQQGRLAFAGQLVDDPGLASAMGAPPVPAAGDQTAFDVGAFRIRLVPRDRAMFVQAVEQRP